MPHHTPLITTIVVALVLAFILGAVANRFRIPPLVGYLLAGVLIGPFTPGYVADQSLAHDLAEIGVILLMFGVGLHFTLEDLLSVRAIAVPTTVPTLPPDDLELVPMEVIRRISAACGLDQVGPRMAGATRHGDESSPH